jgi:hypothetical protein
VFVPTRRYPCNKTKFGIYTGKYEKYYGRIPGQKNYGTYCYPKCPEDNMKLNTATNRCRYLSKDKKERITRKEFHRLWKSNKKTFNLLNAET